MTPTPQNPVDPSTGPLPPDQPDPILEALKGPLGKLIQDDVRLAIDPEKIYQYAEIRKNELYWRGNQYLDEVYNGDGQLVDYRPINGTWHQENPDSDDGSGLYDSVINDIRGYGRKFIAVLAQSPPNVKAEPNDEQNEDHIRRAKMAQRLADMLHNLWDVKEQNRKLFLTYYKNGTAFGHTFYVADEEKYGYTDEPVMEMQPTPAGPSTLNCVGCGQQTPAENPAEAPMACPGCGSPFGPEDLRQPDMVNMPVQTGTKRYANGCVEHRVESGLRVTTQFDIEQLTDAPWLLMEFEQFKGKIFQDYPEIRKKFINEGGQAYGEGGTATTSGQITRDIASSPSGTYIAPRKNRLLFSQCWLRPIMYELARGTVTIQDKQMELREALQQLYPTGVKVTQVNGDTVVRLEGERMDDAWALSPPEPAENAYPDPICKDYMSTQDLVNDLTNIQRQTWERAIPQTMIDTRRIDTTFQAKYRQLPASFIPIQGGGGDIKDSIATVAVAKPEPEMESYVVEQRQHNAEIIGITPAIYGGGAAEQTAYATNLKRNQAMLQLSIAADAARSYWCKVTFNGVMLMAKKSKGVIPSPYSPSTESVNIEDLQDLLKGGFHFEGGDAMPMSWPEQREQLNENLKNLQGNPQLLHQMGYDVPANLPMLQDRLVGMPDWKVPNQDALNKVYGEIRQLLQSKPTQQPSQQSPGQTVDLPSVPVDEYDPHDFVAAALSDWFQTDQAQNVRQQNPDGYSNVVAFWKSHQGLAMPPPPPPGPPGPGAPPPGPPQGGPQQMSPPPGGDQAQGPPPQ